MIGTATVGNITMDYCRFGDGKRVFVIIPGLSVKPVTPSAEAVAAAYADFSKEYTVYLFDRRTNIPDHYSIDEMASDTIAVMRSLGIEKISIFGASQGGMIAQTIALQDPELVENMILGSTCARCNDTIRTVIGRWIRLAETGKGYELNADFSETVYSAATYAAYKDALLPAGNDITNEELARFVVIAHSILSFDVYDRLYAIKCRTLVLGCEGDRVMTAQPSLEMAEKLNCDRYIYDNTYGHAVYDEAPDYRQRMLDFLK